jgi:integrase
MVVIRGKGGKERWVRPPQDVMSKLQRFARPGPIWLTQAGEALKKHQIRKLIYRLAARAGLDDVHPHRFRATFAVNFYEATKDIQALKDILGHESIATTERYIEYTKRQRSLQLMADLQWSAWTSPGRPCACGCGRMVTGKASRNYFDSGCRTKATRARQKEVAVRSQELSRSA